MPSIYFEVPITNHSIPLTSSMRLNLTFLQVKAPVNVTESNLRTEYLITNKSYMVKNN